MQRDFSDNSSLTLVREVKPKLRGWLHAIMLPLTIAAGIALIALAPSISVKISAAIYTATAVLLFGVSAIYHKGHWSPKTTEFLKRCDHANIYLIIAGTYTPTSLIVLPATQAKILLTIVWTGALMGAGFRILWVNAPRWLYVPLYVVLGWVAIAWISQFFNYGGVAFSVLLIVGGLLYTIGAVIYALQKPDPSPRWFGFHEVFHAFTIAGFASHHIGIWLASFGVGTVAVA